MAESPESGNVIEPKCLNPDSDLSYNANCRAEIDTSAPFESVREAANRFGGFGFWRPSHNAKAPEAAFQWQEKVMELKAQAAELQNDLIVKERETLHVLKELEATKATVEELNSKLQEKNEEEMLREDVRRCHIKPAGVVLKDLNQAKMNLCKTTVDLAGIRGSVERLNNQLEEERAALEKTRERLMLKCLNVISLEEEVSLRSAKKGETGEKDALAMMNEVQRLSREAQEFKKTGEDARTEVARAMAEIEHTRDKIKTAKIRLVAARKMKEAARAAEAVAIAEIKAVTGSKSTDEAVTVTISAEEYAALARKAREAEEDAIKRVEDAMSRVEEANVSKMGVLKKVDEAAREIETSKRALEEAVERVDAANATKLEVEEVLLNLPPENGQRRRSSSSVNNTSKFKNRRETTATRLMDVNGLSLTYDVVIEPSSPVPVLKPTMSIGQILSKKLLLAEDSEMNVASGRRKMSLGQMLAKNSDGDKTVSKRSAGKENGKRSATRKRKSFGFAKISVLLNKESKNKKKKKKKKKKEIASNLR